MGTDTLRYPEYAGYLALACLQETLPEYIETLEPPVWEKWAPAVIAYFRSNFDAQWKQQVVLMNTAYQYAPAPVIDALRRIVRYGATNERGLPSILTDPSLNYDTPVWRMLLDTAGEPEFPHARLPEAVERVLEATRLGDGDLHKEAADFIARFIDDPEVGFYAARILFASARGAGWDVLWPRLRDSPEFADRFLEAVGGWFFFSERPLNELTEQEVANLYVLVSRRYPHESDPEIDGVHHVNRREEIGRWRDTLLRHLRERETPAARYALAFLVQELPEQDWLPHTLRKVEEAVRRNQWQPPASADVLDLLRRRDRRLVHHADHLMEVVLETLEELERDLHGELPQVESLWNEDRPKNEEALSNFVAVFLKNRIAGRGVVIGREVQIHHTRDRLDIRVDAVRPSTDGPMDTISVVIEVKGCWHRSLQTAMDTQLLNQYLRPNEVRHGIYLVGWFLCEEWTDDDYRKRDSSAQFQNREGAQRVLTAQAQQLSSESGLLMRAVVLDATRI